MQQIVITTDDTPWSRVEVDGKLWMSTDNVDDVIKAVRQSLLYHKHKTELILYKD